MSDSETPTFNNRIRGILLFKTKFFLTRGPDHKGTFFNLDSRAGHPSDR